MRKNLKNLYFEPSKASGYSTVRKLVAASPRNTKRADIKTWLLKQDSYTLHRLLRKRFPRHPFDVTNIMDVWECDLIDIQNFSIYNDRYKYLLSLINVFSKFVHIVTLRKKTGTAAASAFRAILAKYSHRRPIWVRTDRIKEFLNSTFQDMLKEGIQYQVCRDPKVKCAIVERSHHTIRDKLYKYMTKKQVHILRCTAEIRSVQRYGSQHDWHGIVKSDRF
jgi:hypothetical protein